MLSWEIDEMSLSLNESAVIVVLIINIVKIDIFKFGAKLQKSDFF